MNRYFDFDDAAYQRAEDWDHAHDPDQLTVEQARASAALCDRARVERRHAAEALILRRAMGLRS